MAILRLFTSLSLFIPGFTSALLKGEALWGDEKVSSFCMLIGDAIRDILSPYRNAIAQSADLARAIMDSLEAVCWSVADDYADK